jgi:hypothetical protein
MLPITQSEKEERSKFQRFLFQGFADINELKAAVFANNPDVDQELRSLIDRDLSMLASFIDNAQSTQNIVGGMVQIVEI